MCCNVSALLADDMDTCRGNKLCRTRTVNHVKFCLAHLPHRLTSNLKHSGSHVVHCPTYTIPAITVIIQRLSQPHGRCLQEGEGETQLHHSATAHSCCTARGRSLPLLYSFRGSYIYPVSPFHGASPLGRLLLSLCGQGIRARGGVGRSHPQIIAFSV